MKRTVRQWVCVSAAAIAIPMAGMTTASASAAPGQHTVAVQQADDPPGSGDTSRNDNDGDNGLWGLLGLLGLLGLGGLVRRDRKPGAMTDYPAETAEPPANQYPPAQPRRTPPGA